MGKINKSNNMEDHSFDKWFEKQMKNKDFREAYEAETLRREVANQLTAARKKRHITQKKLAALLHMPQQQISKIENGEQNITLDTLSKIITGLKGTAHIKIAV